jgi:hypothetical protein
MGRGLGFGVGKGFGVFGCWGFWDLIGILMVSGRRVWGRLLELCWSFEEFLRRFLLGVEDMGNF